MPNMALQRTHRPRVPKVQSGLGDGVLVQDHAGTGRSLRSLGAPLNAQPLGGPAHSQMKALLVGLLLLGFSGVPAEAKAEAFDTFLQTFITSEQFRLQRTRYPLTAKLGSSCEEDWQIEEWSRARVRKERVVPLSSSELAAEGLQQRITKSPARKVELFQYRDEADSYLLTYRFELIAGRWFLTYLEDGSC